VFLPRWTIHLGEGYLVAGRIEAATTEARRALTLSRDCKQRGTEAWALRLLGEIDVLRDPPEVESAEAHHRQAIVIANELDMRPLLAHCHFGLGKLHARVGTQRQARAELSIAIDMYRAMDMTFWLLRAEEALAAVEDS
jgi:hypothetical protein